MRAQAGVLAEADRRLAQNSLLPHRLQRLDNLRILRDLHAPRPEPRILRGIQQKHQHLRPREVPRHRRQGRILPHVVMLPRIVIQAYDPPQPGAPRRLRMIRRRMQAE